MDIQSILKQVDAFFETGRPGDAEKLMLQSVEQAVQEGEDGVVLQLLNELIGYYRETSQKERVYQTVAQALEQALRMGLEGTIPYATTLLNAATAYRACGRLEESMEYYNQVQELYHRLLKPDDMLMAGLKNNISLLFQEMGNYGQAKERLLEALAIVEKNGAAYETGVTYANLAGTCMQLGENREAYDYAMKSLEVFGAEHVEDSHSAAALATLGACFFHEGAFGEALDYYRKAMETVERNLGRNAYYERLRENVEACEKAKACRKGGSSGRDDRAADGSSEAENGKGLALSRAYYEEYGRPMIRERFAEWEDKLAVGLAGRGSDCFGFDDEFSRDHDWGPDFCIWVTEETYRAVGEELQRAYETLPGTFQGYTRGAHVNGRNRRGVIRISDFYRELTGAEEYEDIDWKTVSDASLAAAVNGEVFRDEEGVFSAFREKLMRGYPEEIRYLKLAEGSARYAQSAQYNYPRILGRKDRITAEMVLWEGIKEAMKLQHYIEGKYPPHDKWLLRSMQESPEGARAAEQIRIIAAALGSGEDRQAQQHVEDLGKYLAMEMYGEGFISDTESYLDAHSEELVFKASLAAKESGELVEEIARLEFEAFDKVKNEGGRASCQNDWATFSIMRKSQYLTWNRAMLLQYLYDFHREYHRGHNLIEEKYGRMMESTAPEKYREIKSHFPELTQEKKAIIEQIVGLQVGWMESFSAAYPVLAGNARKIHTSEDTAEDTSYETYLRGELGTYSDKMLELYGRYVVEYAHAGRNTAYDIMENSVKMYGYKDIDTAEREIGDYEKMPFSG